MSEPAFVVENLSKSYLVGHKSDRLEQRGHATLRDVIVREARSFARNAMDVLRGRQVVQGDEIEEFWALKNVNFEVKQGEAIGIIGRNGAGKSTLLKILSRITEPTEGRVKLRGRVASLLEVGTGFHAELTGRENIFLNGAILGMKKQEIRRKFDEIVEFSQVDKFLDTPVKRYSSGMYVRLAFAVAAHLEPEILIVDEVLAVGDAEFQKKCLGKMDEVSRRDGRTVLFVSHNMGAITSLCPQVIWLDQGLVRQQGAARAVIGDYLNKTVSSMERLVQLDGIPRHVSDEDRLRLVSLEWLCDLPLRHGEPLKARIRLRTERPLEDVTIGIGFSSFGGGRLLTYDSDFPGGHRLSFSEPGLSVMELEVDSLPLAPDIYSLDVGCRSGDFHTLDYLPAVIQLEVISGPKTPGCIAQGNGGVRLAGRWARGDQKRSSARSHQVMSGNSISNQFRAVPQPDDPGLL
jgi:lipopolysaccharide transport system ATP-binding protein